MYIQLKLLRSCQLVKIKSQVTVLYNRSDFAENPFSFGWNERVVIYIFLTRTAVKVKVHHLIHCKV